MEEQVDGLTVFAVHSLHILSQLKQSGGGQLGSDTKLNGGRSKDWNIFALVDLTLTGAKVGRVLRTLFSWNTGRAVCFKNYLSPACHTPIGAVLTFFARSSRHCQLCSRWNYLWSKYHTTFLLKAVPILDPSPQAQCKRRFSHLRLNFLRNEEVKIFVFCKKKKERL